MLEKHKLQPKRKPTDESKAALQQTLWEELPHEHYQQSGDGELNEVFDCLHGYSSQWWPLRASAINLSISVSASSSHHEQIDSFQSYQQTGEDWAWNAKK